MKKINKKRTGLLASVRSFFGWPAGNGDGPGSSSDLKHTGACPAHPPKITLAHLRVKAWAVPRACRGVGLILPLALLAFSCSKKSPTSVTPPEVQANYYPLTVGSWWKYDTKSSDPYGPYSVGTCSTIVSGALNIGGVMSSRFITFYFSFHLRDSSVVYDTFTDYYRNLRDTIYLSGDSSFSNPRSIFRWLVLPLVQGNKWEVMYGDGIIGDTFYVNPKESCLGFNDCYKLLKVTSNIVTPDLWSEFYWFAPGVGRIMNADEYDTSRISSYHIAP